MRERQAGSYLSGRFSYLWKGLSLPGRATGRHPGGPPMQTLPGCQRANCQAAFVIALIWTSSFSALPPATGRRCRMSQRSLATEPRGRLHGPARGTRAEKLGKGRGTRSKGILSREEYPSPREACVPREKASSSNSRGPSRSGLTALDRVLFTGSVAAAGRGRL